MLVGQSGSEADRIYEEKPWLKAYPPGASKKVDIPDISVNDFFNATTEKWKNRTALNFYGKKISFKDLRDKVDRLAAALYDLGLRKGDRAALLLLNTPEHVISFYALLEVGAVITPVSPVYVSSEIRHQLGGVKMVALPGVCGDAATHYLVLFDEQQGLLLQIVQPGPGQTRAETCDTTPDDDHRVMITQFHDSPLMT